MPHLQSLHGMLHDDALSSVISSRRTLRTVDSTMEECARALAASPYPTVCQKVAHLFGDDSVFDDSVFADATMPMVRKDQGATDPYSPVMAAVSADVQTRGTGRLNRQWVDREGESLSVSYVVAMPKTVLETLGSGWLTAAIGIAVVDSLREIVAAVQLPSLPELALKWPNDLFFRGRKLGGILTRATEADADTVAVIVGIGMNLGMEERDLPLPQAISLRMVVEQQSETHDAVTQGLQRETSAKHETSAKKDIFSDYETLRDVVIEKIAGELAEWFRTASEEPQEVRSALHRRAVSLSATVGQRVTVHLVDGTTYSGTAVGIDSSAALLIQCDDGERCRVTAGDVGIDVGGVR